MATIAFHAAHEQFAPSHLIRLAVQAEQAGFKAIHCSDHFRPWSEKQGQSGFSFAWLGAAMQATELPFSVVCAPGQRYHPAIVAQAIATLAEMYPGRFSVELGSGEALNESVTGDAWPGKEQRNERLLESAGIIRKLLAGETISHNGWIVTEEAKLYTRPQQSPLIMAAALSENTAQWAGAWADGLITTGSSPDQVKRIRDAFCKGGGEHKPLFVQIVLSYAATEKEAVDGAYDQWRNNIVATNLRADLKSISEFDKAAASITIDDLRQQLPISADINYHIDCISSYIDIGFERIILHNVNRQQERFINDFGEKLIPAFA